MIGLMVSIFSIVMILVYFASPISRDDEEQGSAKDSMCFLTWDSTETHFYKTWSKKTN